MIKVNFLEKYRWFADQARRKPGITKAGDNEVDVKGLDPRIDWGPHTRSGTGKAVMTSEDTLLFLVLS